MLARMKQRRAAGPQTAITDVYDARRGAFAVRYPVWLILTLGLAGVVAFGVTGFAAVAKDGSAPIVMYAWLCALVIALQSSIFRHHFMRVRLIATLVVTFVCIVVVAYLTFGSLPTIQLPWLSGGGGGGGQGPGPSLANRLESNPWTYTLINFGLLAIFWLDTIRRWVRRAMGLSPTNTVAIMPGEESQISGRAQQDMPSLEELVSGDLIAGAVLTMALSFVLDAAILGHFIPAVGAHPLHGLAAVASGRLQGRHRGRQHFDADLHRPHSGADLLPAGPHHPGADSSAERARRGAAVSTARIRVPSWSGQGQLISRRMPSPRT